MVANVPRKALAKMKKNKEILYLILALLCVWCPLFMGAWNKDKPSSSTSLRSSNPEILANWSALETSFSAFHEFSTGGSNTGENLSIKFNTPISTPTNAANKSWLYEKDVSAVVELHWLDESNNELQMTSGGDLYSSAGLTVTSASTFNGSITLGDGDDLIGSSTSDITFNTDKFTVAGATGNTVVAGTLDVTGNIDPTTYETTNGGFLDEDAMGSDAADKVASQQSIKAYVDAHGIVQIVNFQTGDVNTGTTPIPLDDSIPQRDEGNEFFRLAITPTSATNKLKIDIVVNLGQNVSATSSAALFQDSTANALAAAYGNSIAGANELTQIVFTHYMTAGTTSSTTFKVRAGVQSSGTVTFNGLGGTRRYGGVMASSITITELEN